MYNVFGFLCVVSLIMLIASLIRPKWGTFGKRPDLKRKQISVAYLILMILFSYAASATLPKDTKASTPKNQAQQESVQGVSIKAGIGDSENRWQKEYGQLNGKDPLRNIEINGSDVTIVFVDDHAINISISKQNDNQKNSIIKDMIPADSTETAKEMDTTDSMLTKERITYHSNTLEKALPKSQGTFVVINIINAETNAYVNTVIDCSLPQG